MTRIAFCDDDAALLHQMQDFLEQYRTLRGVQLELAPYTKPMELLADIEAGVRFDVLFLDVLMPGINGINAVREIRRYDTAVQIIFVTSSSEFAVQSYVVGAYYYQLKPIWKDSFFRLTDAVLAECRKRTQHSLILRCKSGVTRITLDSLEYCEVQGRTLGGAGGGTVPPAASAGAAGGRAAVHPAAAAVVHPLRCTLHAAAFPLPGLGAVSVRYRAAGGLPF